MKKNRTYLILLGLALLGVYLYRNRKKPTPTILAPNVPSPDEVVSGNNPVNTTTEELIGVTTNPTEVTDFTADQTTTCYTGCPNPQAVSVINGSCEENNLYPFPLPCAPPNNTDDVRPPVQTGGGTPIPNNLITDTPMETDNLGYASSGVNVLSGVGCGGSSLAQQVIENNYIPENMPSQTQNASDVNSSLVSNTGLAGNVLPVENILPETEVNQESTGVFDFNSGISNALNSDVLVSTSTSANYSNSGLATRNTRR